MHVIDRTGGSGAGRAATPIYVSKRVRNLLLGATGIALGVLCWNAPTAVVLLIGSAFLAVLLSVPVAVVARAFPRPLAVLAVFLAGIGVVVLLLVLVVPRVIVQLADFGRAVPAYGAQVITFLRSYVLAPLDARGMLPAGVDDALGPVYQGLPREVATAAQAVLSGAQASLSGLANAGFLVCTMVVIAVYFLLDARRIEAEYLRAVPPRYRRDARDLWRTMGQTLSGVALASFTLAAAEGLIAWAGLALIGVPAAALLGAVTWLTAFVPLIGSWLGAIPAVLVAATVSPTAALLTAALYVGTNTLTGNVLSPRLLGNALSLPPAVTLAATLAAGEIFGPAGIIFTMPVLAVVTVAASFLRARIRVRPTAAPSAPPSNSLVLADGASAARPVLTPR
jgi:predicted PurR-regulated permease PerM